MKTMPMDFRKSFKQCEIVIDSFEVFIERPTNLKARAQTWSNYKHHKTVVKFLIGINEAISLLYGCHGNGTSIEKMNHFFNYNYLQYHGILCICIPVITISIMVLSYAGRHCTVNCITQNFSMKMVAARAFANLNSSYSKINNFSKYVRIGLLAASRFSRT